MRSGSSSTGTEKKGGEESGSQHSRRRGVLHYCVPIRIIEAVASPWRQHGVLYFCAVLVPRSIAASATAHSTYEIPSHPTAAFSSSSLSFLFPFEVGVCACVTTTRHQYESPSSIDRPSEHAGRVDRRRRPPARPAAARIDGRRPRRRAFTYITCMCRDACM